MDVIKPKSLQYFHSYLTLSPMLLRKSKVTLIEYQPTEHYMVIVILLKYILAHKIIQELVNVFECIN